MGANFHTAYADGTTIFAASAMEPPLSDLDRAISYMKNVIVHCDGVINYSSSSGQLTWNSTLRILFVRADGQLIQNTVAAGGITLTDNQMAYVDLSETNDAAVAVYAATLSTAAASTTKAFNRLVLAYRNAASNDLYLVALRLSMAQIGHAATADAVPWSGVADKPSAIASVAGLVLTGNAGKVVKVNSEADGLELGDVAGSSGGGLSFNTIAVSGQSSIVAESIDDTLTLAAGQNVSIATDADTDTITISAAGSGSEAAFTAPPTAANWIQQNFNATNTSLADFTQPCAGVRLKEAIYSYGNSNTVRYSLRAVPGARWRVTARLRRHARVTSYMSWGLVVRDSSSGKSAIFGFGYEAGGIGGVRMASDTSYNTYLSFGGNQLPYQQNIWLRLEYDGTNCNMWHSFDGYYWTRTVQYGATALWGFLANAATHVGFGYNANNSGGGDIGQEVDLLSWVEETLP